MTIPTVCYDNSIRELLASEITTYNMTETPGFEREYAYDWRDFSIYRMTPTNPLSPCGLVFRLDNLYACNGFGLYIAGASSLGSDIYEVYFEYRNGPGDAFTTLDTVVLSSGRSMYFHIEDSLTLYPYEVRITIDIPAGEYVDVRQMFVGKAYPLAVYGPGQHQGLTPPNLISNITLSNSVAVNGAILGSDAVREERTAEISLEYQHPDFEVRLTWQNLCEHIRKGFPFFYAWNYEDYPKEVVLAAAQQIPPPVNAHHLGKMSVKLPLRCVD